MTGDHWDFVEDLCKRVKFYSIPQGMRRVRVRNRANFSRFLSPLIDADLVQVVMVPAKRVPEMREPLLVGRSDERAVFADPARLTRAIREVLRLARARWAGLPAIPTRVVVATRGARQLHNVDKAGKNIRHALQATHDAGLSEVFVHKLTNGSIQAENWYSEDVCDFEFYKHRPDALEVSEASKLPVKLIEVVGAEYSQNKLVSLYEECNRRGGLSIEYW